MKWLLSVETVLELCFWIYFPQTGEMDTEMDSEERLNHYSYQKITVQN
jgi:hypothetical protein